MSQMQDIGGCRAVLSNMNRVNMLRFMYETILTTWSEVTIDGDDAHTSSIQHNDMAQVERVPVKLM
jgi:hypothetical protein